MALVFSLPPILAAWSTRRRLGGIASAAAALVFALASSPALACSPTPNYPDMWRYDLASRVEDADEVYWARLATSQWMPPTWMVSLCGGHHWGNGGSGPFYCAAGQLDFDVRETLRGTTRQRLLLSSRQTGYVEVRPLSAIRCCVATNDISPSDGSVSPSAMGGCGPTVLIPDRSYLVIVQGRHATFVGPIERSANQVLASARVLAATEGPQRIQP